MRLARSTMIVLAAGWGIVRAASAAGGGISGVVRDSTNGALAGVWVDAYTASDVWTIAEEAVAKMAPEMFKDMQPPIPKISEDTVRRGISEAVSAIAREVAREVIEKVAWEVIPQLAEVLIKEEIIE